MRLLGVRVENPESQATLCSMSWPCARVKRKRGSNDDRDSSQNRRFIGRYEGFSHVRHIEGVSRGESSSALKKTPAPEGDGGGE